MKIVVVGAGAIGSLVGGRLALAGHEVTLVGRPWLQEAVAAHGLNIVTDGKSERVQRLRVVTSVAEGLEPATELIILTMKAYALPAAVEEIAALTDSPPPLMTTQNGIGAEGAVAERFGSKRVLAGTLTIPVEFDRPARIETVHKGGIGLAPLEVYQPDPESIVSALKEAGFTVARYNDAAAMKWSKLLLNMIGNATSAILGWPPDQIYKDQRLYTIEMDALVEARRVMKVRRIRTVELPGYPVPLFISLMEQMPRSLSRPLLQRRVAGGRGGKMPSLYLDLEAGRKELEIDVLNGAVVAAGKQVGVKTPVNQALTHILKGLAAGQLDRAHFHHNPEALLEAIAEFGR